MEKENFFKLFNLFSKKDVQNKKVKILDFKIKKYEENPLYWWKLPICEMKFIGKDGHEYICYNEFDINYMSLTIYIVEKSKKNFLYGYSTEVTNKSMNFLLDRVEVEGQFRHLGLGYALTEMMFKILSEMANINNISIKRIHGAIGTNCNDDPEASMKLYKCFDGRKFNNSNIELNKNGFNTTECNLEYFIN